jgi:hypothetical protein
VAKAKQAVRKVRETFDATVWAQGKVVVYLREIGWGEHVRVTVELLSPAKKRKR